MRGFLIVVTLLALFVAYSTRHLTEQAHVDYEPIGSNVVHFRNKAGLAVHYRRLGAALVNPSAVIITVHGFQEHSEYYEEIAKTYNENNWIVFTLDHVGHGYSEGERGYVQSLFSLAEDVVQFASVEVKPKYPNLPLLLHGHSMGGAITIIAMERAKSGLFTAAYLEAPFVKAHPSSSKLN
jgi:acylglycerol lipase